MAIQPPALVEYGVVTLALLIVYRVLDVAKHFLLNKKGIASQHLACQADPQYPQRIRDMSRFTVDLQTRIDKGEFTCAWRGRDEVRDLLEGMRNLTKAVGTLTTELQKRGP